jgi:RNA polymerase sigma-70 factor (ECF subfamily)
VSAAVSVSPFTPARARWAPAAHRPPTGDNERLVAAHLAGDSHAFPELVRRYRRPLLHFLSRMIGDRERAEDLVQETFIRVHRHLHRFDPSRKFSTWVYTIASNLGKNELRNRSRSPLVLYQTLQEGRGEDEPQPLHFEDAATRPDELFARRHLAELVGAAVSRLAEHHRQVFVLRELEGLSYEEIAMLTGCNLGTVKSRLNRARQAVAQLLGPQLD